MLAPEEVRPFKEPVARQDGLVPRFGPQYRRIITYSQAHGALSKFHRRVSSAPGDALQDEIFV
jgi:hypothetical protein